MFCPYCCSSINPDDIKLAGYYCYVCGEKLNRMDIKLLIEEE